MNLHTLNLEFALNVTDAHVESLAKCGTLVDVNLNATSEVGTAPSRRWRFSTNERSRLSRCIGTCASRTAPSFDSCRSAAATPCERSI